MRRNRSGSHNASLPTEWRDLLACGSPGGRFRPPSSMPCSKSSSWASSRPNASKQREGSPCRTTSESRLRPTCVLPIVGLDLGWYRDVTTVIVSPSVAVRSGKWRRRWRDRERGPGVARGRSDAPWTGHDRVRDQAVGAARHPERGRNVVFHEFAHKLDMADGRKQTASRGCRTGMRTTVGSEQWVAPSHIFAKDCLVSSTATGPPAPVSSSPS